MNYIINEINKITAGIMEQTYVPGHDIDNLIYETEFAINAFEKLKEDLIKLKETQ